MNGWIPSTTIVLACISSAFAQSSYQVTDLHVLHNWNQGCAMAVNGQGWTEGMDGILDPSGHLATGRAVLNHDGTKIDLGTLGGANSWTNYNGLNDYGEAVGYAETSVPDPNGEDVCLFGTYLTCRPFLWQSGVMRALPTFGGNNGQASQINNHGQITGYAETTTEDSGCAPNRITMGAVWGKGNTQPLPPLGTDPDSVAFGINDQGEAVGYSGTCTSAVHAVVWENGAPLQLEDLKSTGGNLAVGINREGVIVGEVGSADNSTFYASLWKDRVLTNLRTLPGDFAAFAEDINNLGQVVGSTLDSSYAFAHAFIWQNGVMTDLNTLFPASSNLYATMANSINDSGQISGMATVLSGPDMGQVHEFLATPVNGSMGPSVADIATTRPPSNLPPINAKQLLRRVGLGQLGQ